MGVCIACDGDVKGGYDFCYPCNEERKEPEEYDHDGVITETPNAVLFRIGKGLMQDIIWIPKSQMPDFDNHTMWIPVWLAEEKNLA